MATTRRLWLLTILLIGLFGLCAAQQPGSDQEQDFQSKVRTQISLALAAATPDEAQAILDVVEQQVIARDAGSDGLSAAFLLADITQARGKVLVNFILNGRQQMAEQAGEYLTDSIKACEQLSRQADDAAKKIVQGLGQAGAVRSERYQRFMGMTSRGDYSIGWSRYYLGLIAEDPDKRDEQFSRALERFEGFIAPGYRNNPLVADVFFGAGLCLYEMGAYPQLRSLLDEDVIRPDNTPRREFAKITRLRVRNYHAMGMHYFAALAAGYYLDSLSQWGQTNGQLGAADLSIFYSHVRALARSAVESKGPGIQEKSRAELSELTGDILLSQDPRRFAILGIFREVGYASPGVVLYEAKEAFDARQYETSLAKLASLEEKDTDPRWQREVMYLKVLCTLKLGKQDQAVLVYLDFIRNFTDDQRAGDLVRAVVSAGLEAVRQGGLSLLPDVEAVLDDFSRRFPEAVDERLWYRALLSVYLNRGERALESLKQISDTGPYAVRAKYLLGYVRFEQLTAQTAENPSTVVFGTSGGDGWFVRRVEYDRQNLDTICELLTAFCEQYDSEHIEQNICQGAYRLGIAYLRFRSLDTIDAPFTVKERLLFTRLAALGCVDGEGEDVFDVDLLTAAGAGDPQKFDTLIKSREKWTPQMLLIAAKAAQYLLDSVLGNNAGFENNFGLHKETPADDPQVFPAVKRFYETAIRQAKLVPDEKNPVSLLLTVARGYRRMGQDRRALDLLKKIEDKTTGPEKLGASMEATLAFDRLGQYEKARQYWRYLTRTCKPGTDGFCFAYHRLIAGYFAQEDDEQGSKLLTYYKLRYWQSTPENWQRRFAAFEQKGTKDS